MWPTYEHRSPDVVIADGRRWHVAIEAKLGAPLKAQQLIDEYREGCARNREFWLIALTAGSKRPSGVRERRDGVAHLREPPPTHSMAFVD